MSNLEFTTIEKNGIEFYISNDGKTTGMSIAGLTRCCGIDRKRVRTLLENSSSGGGTNQRENASFENCAKFLKPFGGKYFIDFEGDGTKVENNAKMVKAEVCAAIIEYYAFESRAKNETALNCYRSFAINGIQGWIKQVTGYSEPVQTDDDKFDILIKMLAPKLEQIETLNKKVAQLEPVIEEYNTLKDGISINFKGLETLIDELNDDYYMIDNPKNEYSLTEWLATKHIELDYGGIRKFGRNVAETFKSCTKEMPKKANRKKSNGKWSNNVTVYSSEHFPLLEMALDKFIKS